VQDKKIIASQHMCQLTISYTDYVRIREHVSIDYLLHGLGYDKGYCVTWLDKGFVLAFL
jgi:hypothetical protein